MALLLALARNVPAGPRLADGGQVGALEVLRRRADGQDARHPRLRPHRPARRRSARRASACASSPSTRSSAPSATASSASRRPRPPTSVYARGRLHHAAPAQDARDRGLARRRGVREDARTACAILNVARGPLIVDEDLAGGARLRQGRRRGARRLPLRADHRAPALRLPERDRHAAPRRLDRRGDRPRRLPGRRAGRRRAHRRRGHDRGQRARRRRRGPRGARAVPAAVPRSSAASPSALAEGSSIDRVEVEFLGRIAERDTRPLGRRGAARRPAAATPRRTSTQVNAPVDRRRSAGSRSPRRKHATRPRLHRPRARDRRRRRPPRARRRHDARPPQPPAPARGLGPALQPPARASTSRCSATRDVPGMVGRVGTAFGEQGVNISSAAVGHAPDDGDGDGLGRDGRHDRRSRCRQDVVDEIVAGRRLRRRAARVDAAR